MNIYVVSSWKNARYPSIIRTLREAGHSVFDFRNSHGSPSVEFEADFAGSCDYKAFLSSDIAVKAFRTDYSAMSSVDACVLVLPSGRSSHIEAGWFIGRDKPWADSSVKCNNKFMCYLCPVLV